MRVITGTARGRRLKELQGMETRPTTDKVKESLFSIIQFDIEGRRVLDLFAVERRRQCSWIGVRMPCVWCRRIWPCAALPIGPE